MSGSGLLDYRRNDILAEFHLNAVKKKLTQDDKNHDIMGSKQNNLFAQFHDQKKTKKKKKIIILCDTLLSKLKQVARLF
jgi:hypothetical protein